MIRNRLCLIRIITTIIITFFLFYLAFLSLNPLYAENSPQIFAESALVMEAETGKILWEKNCDIRMYPASTTKMLTAIIAIESVSDLSEKVKISENADGRNHSAFSFRAGEEVSVLDLIKAALICSHNNATIALAEHIAGSEEDFIKIMNRKALKIGADQTHFQNTNGLDSDYPLHLTTARDLAIIARYCLNNPLFSQIVNTDKDIIMVGQREIEISNTNDLLEFEFIKGIKTGYTARAGYCIVTYSDTSKLDLITVILNSTRRDREDDALTLINYVNQNYDLKQVVDHSLKFNTVNIGTTTRTSVDLYPGRDYYEFINKGQDQIDIKQTLEEQVELPVRKNQKLGSLSIYINDQMVEEIPLVSNESLEKPAVDQKLAPADEERDKKIMIFAFGFYFFIFLFIIVKNLFFKTRFYV